MDMRTAEINTPGTAMFSKLTMAIPDSTIGYLSNSWPSYIISYLKFTIIQIVIEWLRAQVSVDASLQCAEHIWPT